MNLDLDVLRTVVAAAQLGSFSRAAREVHRSQGAVSQQLKRLEEQLGEKLFQKRGRNLAPTDAGEVLLAHAQRMLRINDQAVAAVRGASLEGTVRFGLPSDLAEAWLPAALGRFRRAHPGVRVEAVVDRNRKLLERLDKGGLDLVLSLGSAARSDAQPLARLAHVWIGPRSPEPLAEPLPLAVFEAPCFFREAAIAALDRAGLEWRIAFVSPSLHGLWAAVEAGLGVTLRTAVGLPAALRVVRRVLPKIQDRPLPLSLHHGRSHMGPAALALAGIVREEVRARLKGAR